MENTTPNFSPLTPRQRHLLEEIKFLKEKLKDLHLEMEQDRKKVQAEAVTAREEERKAVATLVKEIDDLSVKALRSGLLRGLSAESRRPGFRLVFKKIADSPGKYEALVLPGAGDFHPDLPPWARKHFVDWIQLQRLQKEGRETLRETGIVGLETGMERPIDFSEIECWAIIKWRVLELRGAKEEEDADLSPAVANGPPLNTLAEMLEESRKRMVTDEMLRNARRQSKVKEKKRKRTRKNSASWDSVIEILVEEGLLTKKISHQAFKKMWENHLPNFPWKGMSEVLR